MSASMLIDDMGVANIGFLIENIGKDAGELQYLRELTQNAFEVRAGTMRNSALKDFGVYAGHGRVVIYVEPTNLVWSDTARSLLISPGGAGVNYSEIGAAFADHTPDELAAYMAGQVSAEQGDHRKSILKNIKEAEDALDQARYRRAAKGRMEHVQAEALHPLVEFPAAFYPLSVHGDNLARSA